MGDSNYPVMLNLKNKKAVVIGGGNVAKRKVLGLQNTGVEITVISPTIDSGLMSLVNSGDIQWKQKEFSESDLNDAFIIIAATNNSEINNKVYNAKQAHQLVNIVDFPEMSDFHVPSTVRRGRLLLTVSTGGASPGLSKNIRQDLEKIYDELYVDYLDFLHWCREIVLREVIDPSDRRKLLNDLADTEWITKKNRNELFLKMVKNRKNS